MMCSALSCPVDDDSDCCWVPFQTESLLRIYNAVMTWFLGRYPSAVSSHGQSVVKATVEVYELISGEMRPTPAAYFSSTAAAYFSSTALDATAPRDWLRPIGIRTRCRSQFVARAEKLFCAAGAVRLRLVKSGFSLPAKSHPRPLDHLAPPARPATPFLRFARRSWL